MEIQEILEKVKNGAMSVEEAEGFLRREPFEEAMRNWICIARCDPVLRK